MLLPDLKDRLLLLRADLLAELVGDVTAVAAKMVRGLARAADAAGACGRHRHWRVACSRAMQCLQPGERRWNALRATTAMHGGMTGGRAPPRLTPSAAPLSCS